MDDHFEIPLTYKGTEYSFPARLVKWGYIYRIEVDIDGEKVLLEPDEERHYRVLFDNGQEPPNVSNIVIQQIIAVVEGAINY
jgi:hypothetical protein